MTRTDLVKRNMIEKIFPTKIATVLILIFCLFAQIKIGKIKLSFVKDTSAQTISLSVSPPILEAVIKPGEKIEQTYIIENNGGDTTISVDIYEFKEADKAGVARLNKSLKEYDPLNFKSWFEIEDPKISLGEKIKLAAKEKKEIKLSIAPPEETENGDYYFTLVFRTELEDVFVTPNSKAAISQAEIGSNIILTITGDGKINPRPEIKEFKAPKIIDSLGQITYQVEIANKGTSFFKPTGKITITSILGEKYVLNLAPQNIIANSTRTINCIKDEQIIPCRVPTKIFLGPYKATLSFQTEDKKTYEKTATSFGIPLSILGGAIIILLPIFLLVAKIRKQKIHRVKSIKHHSAIALDKKKR